MNKKTRFGLLGLLFVLGAVPLPGRSQNQALATPNAAATVAVADQMDSVPT